MNTHQKSHVEGLGFSSARIFSPLELVDRIPRSEAAAKTVEDPPLDQLDWVRVDLHRLALQGQHEDAPAL